MWSYIDPLEGNLSEVRVRHRSSQRPAQFTELLMDTSALWMVITTESKRTARCRSLDKLSDCLYLSRRPLNIDAYLSHPLPPIFSSFLHMHMPSWTLCRALKMQCTPLKVLQEDNWFKETAGSWRCTTKPEFIDELCLSKLNSQQEFTETLKSLSAITGIFFNHYHSSETACPVLKLIQGLSVRWLSQHWLPLCHWNWLIYLTYW